MAWTSLKRKEITQEFVEEELQICVKTSTLQICSTGSLQWQTFADEGFEEEFSVLRLSYLSYTSSLESQSEHTGRDSSENWCMEEGKLLMKPPEVGWKISPSIKWSKIKSELPCKKIWIWEGSWLQKGSEPNQASRFSCRLFRVSVSHLITKQANLAKKRGGQALPRTNQVFLPQEMASKLLACAIKYKTNFDLGKCFNPLELSPLL